MTVRRLARFAAAGSLALAMAGPVGAAQDGAQEPPPPTCPAADPNPTGPTVTIDTPAEGAVAKTPGEATVLGRARTSSPGVVECVQLTLSRVVENQAQEVSRQVTLGDPPAVEQAINWLPPLPFNDTYVLAGQAVGTNRFGQRFAGTAVVRSFRTEIPPATPTGLKVGVNQEKREASLTWNRNPEPDTEEYLVQRAVNDGDFNEGTVVKGTGFVDKVDPGTYRYRLVALRRTTQAEGDDTRLTSAPTQESKAEVRGPSTTTTPANSSTTRPRTATTARPTRNRTPSRVDLRRFSQTTSTLPDGEGEPEEGAFGDLDFGERQDGRSDMTITELGEPAAGDDGDRPTSLLFFAAGLLTFVVLMHLRWIKKEVDRAPLEELPPES